MRGVVRIDRDRHPACRGLQFEARLAWEAKQEGQGAVVRVRACADGVRVSGGSGGGIVQHAEDGAGWAACLVVALRKVQWIGELQRGAEER
jgi:hypothetical protein